MFINEAVLFLIIFMVLIIGGYAIVNRFHITALKRFQLIVSYLGGLSALLITYSIYLGIQTNRTIEKNRIAYNTITNISNEYLNPQKELVDYYPEGFFLYASMNLDLDLSKHVPKTYDPAKRDLVELYGSLRMFEAMESFLTTSAYDLSGIPAWICNFLTWMQSPILQKNWHVLGFNFSDDTREMLARLIVEANKLNELRKQKGALTPQDYDAIAKNFKITPR